MARARARTLALTVAAGAALGGCALFGNPFDGWQPEATTSAGGGGTSASASAASTGGAGGSSTASSSSSVAAGGGSSCSAANANWATPIIATGVVDAPLILETSSIVVVGGFSGTVQCGNLTRTSAWPSVYIAWLSTSDGACIGLEAAEVSTTATSGNTASLLFGGAALDFDDNLALTLTLNGWADLRFGGPNSVQVTSLATDVVLVTLPAPLPRIIDSMALSLGTGDSQTAGSVASAGTAFFGTAVVSAGNLSGYPSGTSGSVVFAFDAFLNPVPTSAPFAAWVGPDAEVTGDLASAVATYGDVDTSTMSYEVLPAQEPFWPPVWSDLVTDLPSLSVHPRADHVFVAGWAADAFVVRRASSTGTSASLTMPVGPGSLAATARPWAFGDDVIVGGTFSGTITVPGYSVCAGHAAYTDIALVRTNDTLDVQGVAVLGGNGAELLSDLTEDVSGMAVYVSGTYDQAFNIGTCKTCQLPALLGGQSAAFVASIPLP